MSQPHRESFCIGTTKGILSVVPTLSFCLLLSCESERWQAGSPPVCDGQGSSGQAYYTLWGLCIAYSVVWRMYTHLYKKGIQGHTRAYKGIRPLREIVYVCCAEHSYHVVPPGMSCRDGLNDRKCDSDIYNTYAGRGDTMVSNCESVLEPKCVN